MLSLNILQASEEGVHFIVSRQICLPTPDILQEAPWGMDGPPPYSPVDIEQTLLVSSTHRHIHTRQDQYQYTDSSFVPPSPLHHDKYSLSGANDPWRYYSPIKAERVIQAVPRALCLSQNCCIHISHLFFFPLHRKAPTGFTVSSTILERLFTVS